MRGITVVDIHLRRFTAYDGDKVVFRVKLKDLVTSAVSAYHIDGQLARISFIPQFEGCKQTLRLFGNELGHAVLGKEAIASYVVRVARYALIAVCFPKPVKLALVYSSLSHHSPPSVASTNVWYSCTCASLLEAIAVLIASSSSCFMAVISLRRVAVASST